MSAPSRAAGAPDADVARRLAAVRERIAAAATRAGRDPGEVVLVGVAKRQPAGAVADAVRAGLGAVGENFVQEARVKIPEVQELLDGAGAPRPRWHFVGQLQRNKARVVAELFDEVETVDRLALARELDRRAGVHGRRLDVLLQVNISREPQKGGVLPESLPELLAGARALSGLCVRGLMTVPAASAEPETARPAFAALRALRDAQSAPDTLPELSMGMSADYEIAIEEGATRVRIGTALFGARR